jgi:hypothetical protein
MQILKTRNNASKRNGKNAVMEQIEKQIKTISLPVLFLRAYLPKWLANLLGRLRKFKLYEINRHEKIMTQTEKADQKHNFKCFGFFCIDVGSKQYF